MKIVTLCICGLGTCFILKMKTEEVLAELGIECEVVPCDLGSSQLEDANLYLIPYGMDAGSVLTGATPVIQIQDVVDAEEIREKLLPHLNASPR